MNGRLTQAQVQRMLTPVRADRVERKQNLTYVPQQEVRAELIRTFGPGNVDHTMSHPEILWQESFEKNGKTYHVVCVMVGCTLRVRDYDGNQVYECTEYHVESNAPQPQRGEAFALAVTSAQSYALRRAAISLGDAWGLHLYAGGQLGPLIQGTLLLSDPESPLSSTEKKSGGDKGEPDKGEPDKSEPDKSEPAPPAKKPASKKIEKFKEAQESVQAGNAAARLQAGLKVDGEGA